MICLRTWNGWLDSVNPLPTRERPQRCESERYSGHQQGDRASPCDAVGHSTQLQGRFNAIARCRGGSCARRLAAQGASCPAPEGLTGSKSSPPAAAAALPGSAGWRYRRSIAFRGDARPSCRARRGVMPGGASAASPSWYRTSKTAASPKEPLPRAAPCAAPSADPTALIRLGSGPRHQVCYTASVPVRRGSDPAYPWSCHRLDFAPKRAPKTRARRPPPHRSRNDVSCLRSSLLVLS